MDIQIDALEITPFGEIMGSTDETIQKGWKIVKVNNDHFDYENWRNLSPQDIAKITFATEEVEEGAWLFLRLLSPKGHSRPNPPANLQQARKDP